MHKKYFPVSLSCSIFKRLRQIKKDKVIPPHEERRGEQKLQKLSRHRKKRSKMTTTTLKEKKHKKTLLDEFKEEVTCPVCLEVPRWGGLLPCPNSHLICEACYEELETRCGIQQTNLYCVVIKLIVVCANPRTSRTCPTCRESFVPASGSDKPRSSPIAEKVLDKIKFPCR